MKSHVQRRRIVERLTAPPFELMEIRFDSQENSIRNVLHEIERENHTLPMTPG